MQETEIHDYARRLLEIRGAQAIAHAAQKASAYEQEGNDEEAATWRRIERALLSMHGPHAS
ncbi:MAG: hypothetical protein IT536_12595 [Hyphomicrobiales bacterium]|nr:hypothetical protein [Hyphomicrobiales bacterium]